MSALADTLDPYRLRIAAGADAFSNALVSYTAAQAAGTVTDGPFLSSRMRAALQRLDDDIAAARRRVRALPHDTPGRSQAYAALGTLRQGYSELQASLEALGTQPGIDAAALAEQHLAAGGEGLRLLRRYL
jgi:hypothetical protein